MRKIERLRRDALIACEGRGHAMGLFQNRTYLAPSFPEIRYARCLICNKQVTINSHPAPNEIEIGGQAVALDCED